MFFIKILIWLSIYFILYIIFSLNTLISIFCFVIVVFINCILLFQLHIEYLTYLILLLYLGGILIFFLFTALMLNNEYRSNKISTQYSLKNVLLFVFILKFFFLITCLNYNICFFRNFSLMQYFPTFIENNYFLTDLTNNYGDVYALISLYSDKSILLLILGLILLFTMMGVIVITKNKNV